MSTSHEKHYSCINVPSPVKCVLFLIDCFITILIKQTNEERYFSEIWRNSLWKLSDWVGTELFPQRSLLHQYYSTRPRNRIFTNVCGDPLTLSYTTCWVSVEVHSDAHDNTFWNIVYPLLNSSHGTWCCFRFSHNPSSMINIHTPLYLQ